MVKDVTTQLQTVILKVNKLTEKWRIQQNEVKSTHIISTNRNISYVPIIIGNHIGQKD